MVNATIDRLLSGSMPKGVGWNVGDSLAVLAKSNTEEDDRLMVRYFEAAAGCGYYMQAWDVGETWRVTKARRLLPEAARLALENKWGRARESLVLLFGDLRASEYREVVISALDDDEVAGHAVVALWKLPPVPLKSVRPKLMRLQHDTRAWVRAEASGLLVKLGEEGAMSALQTEAAGNDPDGRRVALRLMKRLGKHLDRLGR